MVQDSDRHIMKCEDPDCLVCNQYLEEMREKWEWIWFIIVTNRPDVDDQTTLDSYE